MLIRGTPGTMVVTASENSLQIFTKYNIDFSHDLTKQEVKIYDVLDISEFPERYNLFNIDISLFDNSDDGYYTYKVYDPERNLLEIGKMKLCSPLISTVQYLNYPTEYITYGR